MPSEDYKIEFRAPTKTEEKATEKGLADYAVDNHAVPLIEVPFSCVAYLKSHHIGSLIGKIYWEWLYIDSLWVHPEYRRSKVGSQLMKQAEQKAFEANLKGAWLWTQSWEAEPFYKKMGFEKFTTFENFPSGHERHGLRKYLKGYTS